MNRSIITDQIHPDLETALKRIQEQGYSIVELHNVFGKSIENLNDKEIQEVKKLLDQYDMKVSAISSTLYFLCPLYGGDEVTLFNPDFYTIEGDVERHLEYARRAARISKRLNADVIRVFPFRYPKNRPGPYGSEDDFEKIIAHMKKIAQIGKKEEVQFVLENCPYSHCPKGEMTLRIVQSVNDPHLALLWDPGNSYRAEKHLVPERYKGWSLDEELDHIYPYIRHIHLKNYHYDPKQEKPFIHKELKEGDIDFSRLIHRLHELGYKGTVSLEPEVSFEEAIQCMKTLKELTCE